MTDTVRGRFFVAGECCTAISNLNATECLCDRNVVNLLFFENDAIHALAVSNSSDGTHIASTCSFNGLKSSVDDYYTRACIRGHACLRGGGEAAQYRRAIVTMHYP